jgi:hypothetical protein
MCINPLQPSNGLRTTRFKIQNFHVMTRRRIHVFCTVLKRGKQVFINKTVYVNFAVQIEFLKIFQDNFHFKSLWQWGRFSSEQFCCSLSVSVQQCSIFIFIYTLLLPKGEKGEACQPTKKHLRVSGSTGEKSTLTILRLKVCAMTELVSRRPLTTEARLRSQLSPCEI